MSNADGPKLITNGLVCALNASDKNSYPGSGNTWYDLTGNGYNGTLFGTPPFSSSNGGTIALNGTNQYINVSGINYSSGTSTVFCSARYAGTSIKGRIVNGLNNNWLIGHWSGTTENFYAEGWVSSISAGTNDSKWRIFAATCNTAASSYQCYINGTNTTVSPTNGTQGPNGLSVGRYGPGGTEYSTGYISFIYVYNRILNNSEILENFKSLRSRFGI